MWYDPSVFAVSDLAEAKAIILQPEAAQSTDERWERETAWLVPHLRFEKQGLIVDYGCGIGRIAKLLPHPMIGVDLSPRMRQLAESYVHREDFIAVHPPAFDMLTHAGMRCAGGVAIWALQHIKDVHKELRTIHRALVPDALLWVMNRSRRYVPVRQDDGRTTWANDGVDVDAVLVKIGFAAVNEVPIPKGMCSEGAWLRCYRRRP